MIKDMLSVDDIKVGLIGITQKEEEYVLFGRVSKGRFLFKRNNSTLFNQGLSKDYAVLELKDIQKKFKGYRNDKKLESDLKRYYLKNSLIGNELYASYFDSIVENEDTMEEYCTYEDVDFGRKYIYLGSQRLFGEDLKIRNINEVGRLVYFDSDYTSKHPMNHMQLKTYIRESKGC